MKKILLTGVCQPLGEKYGDAPGVGYELLHGQVTRAQGLFSPRANHVHFSLEYIAENLDAPTTVLQYPTRRALVRELRKGCDVVGVSFVLATFHRMKDVVALIRSHAPSAQIVLGGYGTVLSDEVLKPYGDAICREEGVRFMRRFLGEPEVPMPYRHPLVVSRLRVFGKEVSRTGMVFAGLGCPNGCDFCCTSHFFKRRHVRLLPTGRDIYDVIRRYQDMEPGMPIVVLDEDFLLNRKRALELRACVLSGGQPLSLFVFASIRAISQFTVQEILQMGIDGLWIGYEGSRSGFPKQSGRPVPELFRELREHGVGILASMIVGFPYQTPRIIEEELSGLLGLEPDLAQFLIYGPTPGTPFFDRVMREGLLHRDLVDDRERYYRRCTGFHAMVRHPSMTPGAVETAQRRCFREDFLRLGPSIYRAIQTWLLGYLKLRTSPVPLFQKKARRFAVDLRRAYPVFLVGKLLGPTQGIRRKIAHLERRLHETLGPPTWSERLLAVGALGMALWTALTLKLNLFQHPAALVHTFRSSRARPASVWRRLKRAHAARVRIHVEQCPASEVWVRLEGTLTLNGAQRLAKDLRVALKGTKDRLILDFARIRQSERPAAEWMAQALEGYRARIKVCVPSTGNLAALAALFTLYR